MSACIALRDDYDGVQLRSLARRRRDPRQVRRLLALAAVYHGMSRTQAAKVGGMDRQTLRDWAHRFNEEGPAGLVNRPGAGRPCPAGLGLVRSGQANHPNGANKKTPDPARRI